MTSSFDRFLGGHLGHLLHRDSKTNAIDIDCEFSGQKKSHTPKRLEQGIIRIADFFFGIALGGQVRLPMHMTDS